MYLSIQYKTMECINTMVFFKNLPRNFDKASFNAIIDGSRVGALFVPPVCSGKVLTCVGLGLRPSLRR